MSVKKNTSGFNTLFSKIDVGYFGNQKNLEKLKEKGLGDRCYLKKKIGNHYILIEKDEIRDKESTIYPIFFKEEKASESINIEALKYAEKMRKEAFKIIGKNLEKKVYKIPPQIESTSSLDKKLEDHQKLQTYLEPRKSLWE